MAANPIQLPRNQPVDLAPLATVVRALKDEVIAQLREELLSPPEIAVTVGPPSITLNPEYKQQINIPPCDHDMSFDLTFPGFDQMNAQLASIQKSLDRLITLLSAPVVKTVTRDDGLITRVEERRK